MGRRRNRTLRRAGERDAMAVRRPAAPEPSPSRVPRVAAETRAAARRPPSTGPLFAWLAPSSAIETWASVRWAIPAVLGLAVLLRLLHLVALERSPFAFSLVLDARYYDRWAQDIAAGALIGRAPAWVDPLYAYVLAALYRVAGHHLVAARLMNMVFGIVTVLLVARVAQRVWGSRAVALVAGVMAATCIPTLYFEGQTEKTALTVVLITAAVERFLAGSLPVAGVLTGLAALARGNALLFLPAGALCLGLGWDDTRADGDPAPLPERGRRAAIFFACGLPIVALATLHNWLASGEFVLTTTNLGVNLYLGNHTGNAYGYYERPAFLAPGSGDELPDFRAEAQRRLGRTLTDREVSNYWTGQAIQQVEADPGLAVVRTARKLELALHNDEAADNEDVTMVGEWSPVLRAPFFWMGQLVVLGVLGAVVGWPRRDVQIVAAATALYLASLLPFFVMGRLRVQMAPFLCVLGAGAVVWLVERIRTADTRRLVAAAAVAGPLVVLTFYRPDWMARRRSSELAIVWNNLGFTLGNAGKTDDAIHAYERAVEINDAAVPAALRTLGNLYRDRGDYPRAEKAMRRVLEIKPGSPTGIQALRGLYGTMLQDPRWRDDPQIKARARALGQTSATASAAPTSAPTPAAAAIAQARSLGGQGKFDEAIRVMEDAVRKGPYDEDLHYLLGGTIDRHGTPDEMIRFFSEEVAHDEKPQTSHYFWAIGLERKGDTNGAVAHLRQALEIDPAHEMSQREWGLLLERQGKLEDGLGHLVEATRIHPDFRPAFEDAARVADKLGRTADAATYRKGAASADPNSPRRFVHWARYLHEHGRDEAAMKELERMLAERPNDPEALALRDQIRGKSGASTPSATSAAAAPPAAGGSNQPLAGAARAALVDRLVSYGAGTTWIAYDARDAGAMRLASDLKSAFEEARWTVKSREPLKFAARPGIFVIAGEETSEPARAVDEALGRAGIDHKFLSGYRAYSEERRRADPAWRGIELADGQEFVIVVGRHE